MFNNDEYFAYFEHIFERLIKMNYKYSKVIGTKKNWEEEAEVEVQVENWPPSNPLSQ
jgi:hypothetical protein